jgi:hypothetical protein
MPDVLAPLTNRQATMIAHESFPRDMDGLERDIKALIKPPASRPSWTFFWVCILSAFALGAVAMEILASWLQWRN